MIFDLESRQCSTICQSTCFSFCSKERKKMSQSKVSGEMNCIHIKTFTKFMLKWMICTIRILSFIKWHYLRTTILMWRVSLYNLHEVMISITFIFNQICKIHICHDSRVNLEQKPNLAECHMFMSP